MILPFILFAISEDQRPQEFVESKSSGDADDGTYHRSDKQAGKNGGLTVGKYGKDDFPIYDDADGHDDSCAGQFDQVINCLSGNFGHTAGGLLLIGGLVNDLFHEAFSFLRSLKLW